MKEQELREVDSLFEEAMSYASVKRRAESETFLKEYETASPQEKKDMIARQVYIRGLELKQYEGLDQVQPDQERLAEQFKDDYVVDQDTLLPKDDVLMRDSDTDGYLEEIYNDIVDNIKDPKEVLVLLNMDIMDPVLYPSLHPMINKSYSEGGYTMIKDYYKQVDDMITDVDDEHSFMSVFGDAGLEFKEENFEQWMDRMNLQIEEEEKETLEAEDEEPEAGEAEDEELDAGEAGIEPSEDEMELDAEKVQKEREDILNEEDKDPINLEEPNLNNLLGDFDGPTTFTRPEQPQVKAAEEEVKEEVKEKAKEVAPTEHSDEKQFSPEQVQHMTAQMTALSTIQKFYPLSGPKDASVQSLIHDLSPEEIGRNLKVFNEIQEAYALIRDNGPQEQFAHLEGLSEEALKEADPWKGKYSLESQREAMMTQRENEAHKNSQMEVLTRIRMAYPVPREGEDWPEGTTPEQKEINQKINDWANKEQRRIFTDGHDERYIPLEGKYAGELPESELWRTLYSEITNREYPVRQNEEIEFIGNEIDENEIDENEIDENVAENEENKEELDNEEIENEANEEREADNEILEEGASPEVEEEKKEEIKDDVKEDVKEEKPEINNDKLFAPFPKGWEVGNLVGGAGDPNPAPEENKQEEPEIRENLLGFYSMEKKEEEIKEEVKEEVKEEKPEIKNEEINKNEIKGELKKEEEKVQEIKAFSDGIDEIDMNFNVNSFRPDLAKEEDPERHQNKPKKQNDAQPKVKTIIGRSKNNVKDPLSGNVNPVMGLKKIDDLSPKDFFEDQGAYFNASSKERIDMMKRYLVEKAVNQYGNIFPRGFEADVNYDRYLSNNEVAMQVLEDMAKLPRAEAYRLLNSNHLMKASFDALDPEAKDIDKKQLDEYRVNSAKELYEGYGDISNKMKQISNNRFFGGLLNPSMTVGEMQQICKNKLTEAKERPFEINNENKKKAADLIFAEMLTQHRATDPGGYFGKSADQIIRPRQSWKMGENGLELVEQPKGKHDVTLKEHNNKLASMRNRMLNDKIFQSILKQGGTSKDFVQRYRKEWKKQLEFTAGKEDVYVVNRAIDDRQLVLTDEQKESFKELYQSMQRYNENKVRKGVNEDMMKALKNVNDKAEAGTLKVADMKLLNYTSAHYYMTRKGTFMEPVTDAGKLRLSASADIHTKALEVIDDFDKKVQQEKNKEHDQIIKKNNPVNAMKK